jgi:hypothetical protein
MQQSMQQSNQMPPTPYAPVGTSGCSPNRSSAADRTERGRRNVLHLRARPSSKGQRKPMVHFGAGRCPAIPDRLQGGPRVPRQFHRSGRPRLRHRAPGTQRTVTTQPAPAVLNMCTARRRRRWRWQPQRLTTWSVVACPSPSGAARYRRSHRVEPCSGPTARPQLNEPAPW